MSKEFCKIVSKAAVSIGTVDAVQGELVAKMLVRIGKKSSRLAVDECNRGLTPREKRTVERIEREVEALGRLIGLTAFRQGDPRGYTIRVILPKGISGNCVDGSAGCG